MSPDFTSLFASAFEKYDKMSGSQSNTQAQILDINNIPTIKNMKGSDDAFQKAYERSLRPEEAGLAKFEEKRKKDEFYDSILKSITQDEYDNLKYLINKGGYFVMTVDMLKSVGEKGETLHTQRLEEWGLVKRDKIDAELIQFTIKSMGRQVVKDVSKLINK